jgi:hypothetical protein
MRSHCIEMDRKDWYFTKFATIQQILSLTPDKICVAIAMEDLFNFKCEK